MKKTYIIPSTEQVFVILSQMIAGSLDGTTDGDNPGIGSGGEGGDDDLDFAKKGFFDDDEEEGL